jgi:hypothetical protein
MKRSHHSALRLLAVTTLVTIASAVTAVTAQASYIVNATEIGGDVVFTGSGSLDLTSWNFQANAGRGAWVQPDNSFGVGGPAAADYSRGIDTNFAGPATIGPGIQFISAASVTGDFTGLGFTGSTLIVPRDYVSEQQTAGSATFSGRTFNTLGITPGSYQWTWGSGATADSLTLNVGAVPVPAAVWLFGSGLLGLVGVARRKART